jgi:uncharacterized peroxidase-related enzyme
MGEPTSGFARIRRSPANRAGVMMTDYRSPLPYLTADSAEGDAAARLAATRQAMGTVPNMYGAMANSPGLLATYLDGYQRFRTGSGLTPAEQEAVFLTISRFNECDYCMAAHSFIADKMSKTPVEVTDAIRDDCPVDDERFAALIGMTRTLLATGGHPSEADVAAFVEVGYTDQQLLELILAIAVKTISNWTNHLFRTPVDERFAARTWSAPAGSVPGAPPSARASTAW